MSCPYYRFGCPNNVAKHALIGATDAEIDGARSLLNPFPLPPACLPSACCLLLYCLGSKDLRILSGSSQQEMNRFTEFSNR
ncbi:hypothetical protein [Coleofasciculus sp. G2-EDA-02]|uniref:hypothetical protein n=1 Tax=Coleofasciculus sp. G2-EDA-02 TaxID=3069529 RepID=UPI0032F2A46C